MQSNSQIVAVSRPRPAATIAKLSPQVAEKIAAGEVVLHPCSVVKELVENSLDAGATEIRIALNNGGTERIEVIDNGIGMSFADLKLAVQRHATSKIRSVDDLQQLTTLGFRGEALPSIAAVARLRIESAQAAAGGGALEGAVIELHGGSLIVHEAYGTPVGSRIVVDDLFYATPARRKFLKSPAYEFKRVHEMIDRLALAHPQVAWRLSRDGRQVAHYPATRSQLQRLQQVFNGDVERPWQTRTLEISDQRGDRSLQVFFTAPDVSFANRQQQYFFLNRRVIQDRALAHAVSEAYRTFVMEHRYPGAVVFLQLPSDEFDVNVHPTKEEVRFVKSSDLHQWLLSTLRQALSSFKLNPANKPDKTAYTNDSAHLSPLPLHDSILTIAPQTTLPFRPQQQPGSDAETYSNLKLIGQLKECYLLCEGPHGLVILDQHAAHERVLFERIRRHLFEQPTVAQPLLQPLLVTLQPQQSETLRRHAEELQRIGFEWEAFGPAAKNNQGSDYLLRVVPQILKQDVLQLFLELLDELAEHGTSLTLEVARDRLVATMACHQAVRFHQRLSDAEMQTILKDLDATAGSSNCPHGRPVFIGFSETELARLFKR